MVTDFNFGVKKNLKHFDCCEFWSDILANYYRSFYISRERAPVSVRTILFKCLNEVYKAYTYIYLYNKSYFIDKTSLTGSNKTNPLGGNIAPPPRPDIHLKAQPDWVKLSCIQTDPFSMTPTLF